MKKYTPTDSGQKKIMPKKKKNISTLHVQKENLAPLKSPPAHHFTNDPSLRAYDILPSC